MHPSSVSAVFLITAAVPQTLHWNKLFVLCLIKEKNAPGKHDQIQADLANREAKMCKWKSSVPSGFYPDTWKHGLLWLFQTLHACKSFDVSWYLNAGRRTFCTEGCLALLVLCAWSCLTVVTAPACPAGGSGRVSGVWQRGRRRPSVAVWRLWRQLPHLLPHPSSDRRAQRRLEVPQVSGPGEGELQSLIIGLHADSWDMCERLKQVCLLHSSSFFLSHP